MPDYETWKNSSRGKAAVLKFGRDNRLQHELVGPGKQILLTKEERQINQERAADSMLDLFANGVLTPVKILDEEDRAEFASNPNMMSEEDLRNLFSLPIKRFEAKLAEITNAYALDRLAKIADEDDVKVSVRQAKAIDERINQLRPSVQLPSEVDQVDGLRTNVNPVTSW